MAYGGWEIDGEPYTRVPGTQFDWFRSRMLGGRTNHWGRITLRFGPSDPERPMYAVSVDELAQLAQSQGLVLSVLGEGGSQDRLARAEVSWQTVCLRAAGSVEA